MNTNKLKAYAPKARIAFMEAVKNRAAKLGIFEDRISDITIDGDNAIIEKEVYSRKQGQQRNQLVKRIEALGTHDGKFVHKDGFNQFINETAFTWFNRLTAIRYMEVNEYLDHGFRVLSKAEGAQFGEGFEILNSAADVADELGLNKDQIIDMVLDGNKEEELYRTLLLGQCHQLSEAMPFMFEKLDDATELLLPDNLTKTDSILKDLVNDIPEDNWREIEVIGWLYQFYLSDSKNELMKKKSAYKAEEIPAVTQLFTPNWIVKYLVQNSIGGQWLATYPNSELKGKMEYYITPAVQSDDVIGQLKTITPTSIDPEEIKVIDPACGSGHILVEVYDVLREIYLERGYRLREIPELILTKNIYGLDIDDRAAQMAAFAVLMKAREDDKRIFSREIKLNIHSIQSTENLNINQLWTELDLDNKNKLGSMGDLFEAPLKLSEPSEENKIYLDLLVYLKDTFYDAKHLGSLVKVDSKYLTKLQDFENQVTNKLRQSPYISKHVENTLLPLISQAIILSTKYDVTIANPPYMGSGGMSNQLKSFSSKYFKDSKSDLYSMFIERGFDLLKSSGVCSMVTMQSWMFLSSYKNLRKVILDNKTLESALHIGFNSFPELNSKVVQCVAFCIKNTFVDSFKSTFINLNDTNQSADKNLYFKSTARFSPFYVKQNEFLKIPNNPFVYWFKNDFFNDYKRSLLLNDICDISEGIKTGENERFLRFWHEVDRSKILSDDKKGKWCLYHKGGQYRRWYGNTEHVIDWENNGERIKSSSKSGLQGQKNYFTKGMSWSKVTSSDFGIRVLEEDTLFDSGSPACFPHNEHDYLSIIAFLQSKAANYLINALNPTLNIQVGNVGILPAKRSYQPAVTYAEKLIRIHKDDWNSIETSWSFSRDKLVRTMQNNIKNAFSYHSKEAKEVIKHTQTLERLNNELQLEVLNIKDLVNSDIDKHKISLFTNPSFRFGKNLNDSIYEARYCSAVICELASFAIGCIMGRYSLDRSGLIYANSGNNGFKELVEEGAWKTFPADDDGIVPLADEDWVFEDDATTCFREFVKTVWGEEHLQENLDFVAESLCLDAIKAKKGESSIDTIRRYFSTQFYKDHLKTYKKRPIYWLFSSGKAKAFECLIYLHRYNEGTLSRMRTEYVTPLMGKLESRKNILEDSKATASGAELRAIDKELKTIEKKQAELVTFDEELKHLAEMKISLDLDDGVKVNYGKFGNLLADVKAIHGKNPEVIK
ncbi:BREX-1 system adenine-specific DNA-methyltransferase PglX [Vibrio parahaemolyticus]